MFPPTIGFVFDREGKSERERNDLQKRSQHPVEFLDRRMYENYLLHPDAIAAVLNHEDAGREQPVSGAEVRERLETHKLNKNYFPKPNTQCSKDDTSKHLGNAEWIEKIDAAKVLAVLFAELSEARVQFKKTSHSPMLTEWLLENNPEHFAELAQFLRDILDKGKAALD